MRRYISLLSAVLLMLLLCACGGKSIEPETAAASAEPEVSYEAPEIREPQENALENDPAVQSGTDVPEEQSFAGLQLLQSEERAELNRFLSAFAEQRLKSISGAPESFDEHIDFLHIYVKLHDAKAFFYDELPNGRTYEMIRFADMNDYLDRFFGYTVTEETAASYARAAYDGDVLYGFYTSGRFCFEPADGESYSAIAIADEVTEQGDGSFCVSFRLYDVNVPYEPEQDKDAFYGLTPEEARAMQGLTVRGAGTAILYPAQSGCRMVSYETEGVGA